MKKATITFNRKTSLSTLRSFSLLIDNDCASTIDHDEKIKVNVAPGNHTVCVKIDWLKSNNLYIDVKDDENIEILINEPERGFSKYIALVAFIGLMFGLGTMVWGLIGASIGGGVAAIILSPYLFKPLISLAEQEET